jgi:uncharacterized protein with ATP-grasp and redox domains
MKSFLDCIPCFLRQSLEASRMATDDETVQEIVLKKVMKYLQKASFDNSPPELSREVHAIIRNVTKSKDPYKKVKIESNKMVKNKYHKLEQMVSSSKNPLLMAVKLSIVGNVIDFGTSNRFSLEEAINAASNKHFVDEDFQKFKDKLNKSKTVLYLADNAGEIFFDKLLLGKLSDMGKKLTYVIKANPIINDATIEDARFAEIDKIATILEGDAGQPYSCPGIVLKYASKELLNYLKSSDMVISKGQGNYESLSLIDRDIFFLLMVKCPLVARDINTELAELVLRFKQ